MIVIDFRRQGANSRGLAVQRSVQLQSTTPKIKASSLSEPAINQKWEAKLHTQITNEASKVVKRPVNPEPAGPGTESVWDYPRPPALVRCEARVLIVLNDAPLVDSIHAMRVLETTHPPTFYIPASDVDMSRLQSVAGNSFCEWKGVASYYDIDGAHAMRPRVAWTYHKPTPAFADIAGYIAFYPHAMDACFVGDEQVKPQQGDFYGGWITANIKGPFKGGVGTMGW